MHRVIKKAKHTEHYQHQKLYGSIHSACLSVGEFVGSAEVTAENVCREVEVWLSKKYEITSSDIRRVAGEFLQAYNPSAAYIYVTHNDIN